jgi:hypothetical protein
MTAKLGAKHRDICSNVDFDDSKIRCSAPKYYNEQFRYKSKFKNLRIYLFPFRPPNLTLPAHFPDIVPASRFVQPLSKFLGQCFPRYPLWYATDQKKYDQDHFVSYE